MPALVVTGALAPPAQAAGVSTITGTIRTPGGSPIAGIDVTLARWSSSTEWDSLTSVVTATDGTWDTSGLSYSYQWFKNGQPIVGATAKTHLVPVGEANQSLSVEVRATTPQGGTTSARSAARTVAKLATSIGGGVSPATVTSTHAPEDQARQLPAAGLLPADVAEPGDVGLRGVHADGGEVGPARGGAVPWGPCPP
ncbi:MAG TPA: hypothetical protein VGE77_10405 [Nocardioides sp.]